MARAYALPEPVEVVPLGRGWGSHVRSKLVCGPRRTPLMLKERPFYLEPDEFRLQMEIARFAGACGAPAAEVLSTGASSQDACRMLVDLALDYGGLDNITAVVASYA